MKVNVVFKRELYFDNYRETDSLYLLVMAPPCYIIKDSGCIKYKKLATRYQINNYLGEGYSVETWIPTYIGWYYS